MRTATIPTISFVIPTLNFAAFLPATLDSIVDEGHLPIEIIVFDGGSTDDTLAVLEKYRSKWPALKVISAARRGNIDVDLNEAVAAATGDYVWTMSADDVLLPGWSRTIVETLRDVGPDLVLAPAIHCDIALQPRRDYPILRDPTAGALVTTLSTDEDVLAYLAKVRTSEGLFSFCSACLVRRERLLTLPDLEQANGTCWRYSARLIAVLVDFPSTVVVLNAPLILKRGDNDSFSHAGVIARLKIATVNWDFAIDQLALTGPVRKAMLTRTKGDIKPTTLLFFSQFVRDGSEKTIYDECVRSRMGSGGRGARAFAAVLRRLPRLKILKTVLTTTKSVVRVAQQRRWKARLPATDPSGTRLPATIAADRQQHATA